jgi:dipeptidyl aminopeptidase/acylaminoacyl peptidase
VFSPNGRTLALATGSLRETPGQATDPGKVNLLDLPTGQYYSLPVHPCAVGASVAFSPDGRTLALAGKDGEVVLWETATAKERLRLKGQRGAVKSVLFTPDGRGLLTGSIDTTVLLWDIPRKALAGRDAPTVLPDAEVRRLWHVMGGGDAAAAYRAIIEMAAAPGATLPFLRRNLQAVRAPDPGRLQQWVADLDADNFTIRENANKELRNLRELAEPALRAALAKPASAEARRRINELLAENAGPLLPGPALQHLRAVEALERMGTTEASRILETLSRGVPEARLTQEAKGALHRLAGRPAVKP